MPPCTRERIPNGERRWWQLSCSGTAVSLNTVAGNQSGGGGIANFGSAGDADLTVTGATLVGNLARQGLGGALANVGQGGAATASIASTAIGSTTLTRPYTLNPNHALFGAGIFNWDMGGPASVSLGPSTVVVGNQAIIDGGGVYNADGASLLVSPGAAVVFNHPDNIVDNPGF